MTRPPNFTVTAQGDRQVRIARDFEAPKRLVFDAYTKPEFVRRWLLGPEGWTMPVCEIDLRVGGAYRYLWEKADLGVKMGMGGTFTLIKPHDRIEATEKFDDPWYPGEATSVVTFTEARGVTTLTIMMTYQDVATRDGVLKSPMERGLKAGFDRLEHVLAESIAK